MLLKRQPLTPLHVPLPSLGALLLGREATVVKGVNDIKRIDLWKRQRGHIYMGAVKKVKSEKRENELLKEQLSVLPSSASTIFSCTVVDGRIAACVKKGKGREII